MLLEEVFFHTLSGTDWILDLLRHSCVPTVKLMVVYIYHIICHPQKSHIVVSSNVCLRMIYSFWPGIKINGNKFSSHVYGRIKVSTHWVKALSH